MNDEEYTITIRAPYGNAVTVRSLASYSDQPEDIAAQLTLDAAFAIRQSVALEVAMAEAWVERVEGAR